MRCMGGDSPARRCIGAINRLSLKWHWPPNCHCEGALRPWQSREGSYVFAGSAQLSGQVLRDCHVASLLAMTRQESARCTSALARLNCPPRGAQGTPLHFPSGPFRVFCAKKYRKHRLPVVFQTQSITINHNQLFTSRRPSSGGRSGAGRPHSPEPSGPRAAACSNR